MARIEYRRHGNRPLISIKPPFMGGALPRLLALGLPRPAQEFVVPYSFPLLSLVWGLLQPWPLEMDEEASAVLSDELSAFGLHRSALGGGHPDLGPLLEALLPLPPEELYPERLRERFAHLQLYPAFLSLEGENGFLHLLFPRGSWEEILSLHYPVVAPGRALLSPDELEHLLAEGGFLSGLGVPFYLLARAEAIPALTSAFSRVRLPESRPSPTPALLGKAASLPLWEHQKRGVGFLLSLLHSGKGGGYLAFEMGTGKTLTAIAFSLAMEASRVLVLSPKSVVPTWAREVERWAPGAFRVLPLRDQGNTESRERALSEALEQGGSLFAVTNYDAAIRDPLSKRLQSVQWDLLVLDEAHFVKNHASKRFRVIKGIPRRFTVALSGTPMTQGPLDLWSQAYLLDPSFLGPNYYAFRSTYAVLGGYGGKEVVGYKSLDKLAKKMSRFMVQVRLDDVLELPDALVYEVPVYLSPEARREHDRVWEDLRSLARSGVSLPREAVANALLVAQRITSGFRKDEEGRLVRADTSKEEALRDLLQSLGSEPVVVFAHFHHDLDLIRSVARDLGIPEAELSGREDGLEAFLSGKAQLLAVQIRAGGVGVDLSRSRYAIYYSLGYSLGDYLQSVARIRRPGQTRKTVYYHLIARDTVDERIYLALSRKEEVISAVISSVA